MLPQLFTGLGFILFFPIMLWAADINPQDFHNKLQALHLQQIALYNIRTKEEIADYKGSSAAGYRYVDTHYYDTENGNLVSHIRRDGSKPELIHIIEVNIYENKKLVRDYGSITLPWAPLYPVRTYINLHHYDNQLHSFRQYDVDGQVKFEFCEGSFAGKPVHISLDEGDINAGSTTAEYKSCFDGASKNWSQFKIPH